jgi:hypothetical protein
MTLDPRDLISMPEEDLPSPQSLPAAHFYGQIMKVERVVTPWNQATESASYTVQLLEPGEDVNPTDIAAIELPSYRLNAKNYEITPDGVYMIRRLHKSLGLPSTNSMEQNWVECVGKRSWA